VARTFRELLMRYIGRRVRLSFYDDRKLWGTVDEVVVDGVMLRDTSSAQISDGEPWAESLWTDPELDHGESHKVTLVHFDRIVSVSCDDGVETSPLLVGSDGGREHQDRRVEDHLLVEPLEIAIGVQLVRLVKPANGGDLIERIIRIRESVAREEGYLLPKVRIRDHIRLDGNEYRILLDNCEIGQGRIEPDRRLVLSNNDTKPSVNGIAVADPSFGLPAVWVTKKQALKAEKLGHTVVEPLAVIATHFRETVRVHSYEILSVRGTRELLRETETKHSALVQAVIPDCVSLTDLHWIFCRLLQERVSIRNLHRILEALSHHANCRQDCESLVAAVRCEIGRSLCERLRDDAGRLPVAQLERDCETLLLEALEPDGPAAVVDDVLDLLAQQIRECDHTGELIVLTHSTRLRRWLWSQMHGRDLDLTVLAEAEVPRDLEITRVAHIGQQLDATSALLQRTRDGVCTAEAPAQRADYTAREGSQAARRPR
jgi:flagellar biosynthesis component FlhA